MADVTVESLATAEVAAWKTGHGANVVWTDENTGYAFAVGVNATAHNFGYMKTTDAGDSWSANTDIDAANTDFFCVWYDKWTPGDTGGLIHIAWLEAGSNIVKWRSLDTSDDSLFTAVTIASPGGFGVTGTHTDCVSLTKTRGGNLLVYYDAGSFTGFYRSTDGGTSWTSRSDPTISGTDYWMLAPGFETDNQDAIGVVADIGDGDVHWYTYDDSADSWTDEGQVAANHPGDTTSGFHPIDICVDDTDSRVWIVVNTNWDNAAADLECYYVSTSGGGVTAIDDVQTNADDCEQPCIFYDSPNDSLYVAYLGNDAGSDVIFDSVGVHYKVSTNKSTWGTEQEISATDDDHRFVKAGNGVPSGQNGRFSPVWVNFDLNLLVGPDAAQSIEITSGAGLSIPIAMHHYKQMMGVN